jgi:YD repeat-containing protein
MIKKIVINMKHLYLLIFCVVCSVSAYGQYADVPYSDDPVLPNRRLVKNQIAAEKVYGYRFGSKGIKDSVLLFTRQYTYNALHQLVKQETTTGSAKPVVTKYVYDKYNNLAKQVEFKGKADSTVYEFGYDTLGNTRFIYKYNKDTSNLQTTQNIYNSKNQLISVLMKIGYGGEFFTIRNLTYNEDGDLYNLEYLDPNGNTTAEYAFAYDHSARKRLVYKIVNEKRKLYQAYTYTINKDQSRMEQFNYVDLKNQKSAAATQITKYYYDDFGLLTIEVTYDGDKMDTYTRHFYEK